MPLRIAGSVLPGTPLAATGREGRLHTSPPLAACRGSHPPDPRAAGLPPPSRASHRRPGPRGCPGSAAGAGIRATGGGRRACRRERRGKQRPGKAPDPTPAVRPAGTPCRAQERRGLPHHDRPGILTPGWKGGARPGSAPSTEVRRFRPSGRDCRVPKARFAVRSAACRSVPPQLQSWARCQRRRDLATGGSGGAIDCPISIS